MRTMSACSFRLCAKSEERAILTLMLKRIVSQSGANRNIAETDCCGEAVESPSISLANEQKAAAVPAMERQGQSFSGSPGRPPAFLCRTECAVLAPVVSALGGFE